MLRSLCFVACLVSPSIFLSAAGLEDVIPLTKPWLDPRPYERSVPRVEEAVRLKMIAELHRVSGNSGVRLHYGQSSIDILLIDLGDEATIDKYIERYFGTTQNRGAGDVLFASRQPALIALVEPYLFRDESADLTANGDQIMPTRSAAAAALCRDMVLRCPDFNDSAKAWAAQVRNLSKDRFVWREEVRVFWRENEGLLKAKNYLAVRPPSNPAANPPRAQPVISRTNSLPALPVAARAITSSPPTVIASNPPPTPAPAVAAITKPAPIPSTSPTNAPSSDSSQPPPVWPWLLGVGIALAAVLWRRSH